jgi:type III secretion protein C
MKNRFFNHKTLFQVAGFVAISFVIPSMIHTQVYRDAGSSNRSQIPAVQKSPFPENTCIVPLERTCEKTCTKTESSPLHSLKTSFPEGISPIEAPGASPISGASLTLDQVLPPLGESSEIQEKIPDTQERNPGTQEEVLEVQQRAFGITAAPPAIPAYETPGATAPGATKPGVVAAAQKVPPKKILINFNNVNIIEYIRFISKISGKNFVFDENDLQFTVTIVSEEPTTIENIMSALVQELRIHGLALIEQDDNLIIHRTPSVNAISKVVADGISNEESLNAEMVTRVFRLNTADPNKAAAVLRPLVSAQGLVEVFVDTNSVIITDVKTNIQEIAQLLKSLDAPNSGLVIGQFVVRNAFIDNVILLAQRIMLPISQTQPLIFVPHRAANSIFVVSTPFLVERTLAIMQYIDQNQGTNRIFNLKDLRFFPDQPNGGWQLDENGNWVYRPTQEPGAEAPPQGYWITDDQGNWRFIPGQRPANVRPELGPEGKWIKDAQGNWYFQLAGGKSISSQRVIRNARGLTELPPGSIERTQFSIHKLRYRKGDQIQIALARIGQSLSVAGSSNGDLIEAINSIQWIESSNSLIFSGTGEALSRVKQLIEEIDTPLRQVFIEMLILDTTIDDALRYAVSWETQFGGGNVAGQQAFLPADRSTPLPDAMRTTIPPSVPNASGLAEAPGYNLGIIGRVLSHNGTFFDSLGALVKAIHVRDKTKIILNPKILTEDNTPAEIFVGINTQFPTQAVVNDRGLIITQNFEYRDIGTRLRVTPLIGNNDIITLTITEEVSNVIPNTGSETGLTTSKSTTTTKVHLPNEFFLIMSGMIQNQITTNRTQIPCLGGLPVIGAAFSDKLYGDQKRNLMIFIRPKIVDTDEEIQNITKHQQDVFRYKNRLKTKTQLEVEEFNDFLNLPKGDGSECVNEGQGWID